MANQKSTADSSSSIPSTPVPIVAIGASAGGQEAVVELLQNLSPTTGLAYVYIQHLDPTQESRLVDILGRATSMIVQEAAHLMRIKPNQVYIIPPDRDLEVLDGVLTLQVRQPRPAIHMPVDQFFLSLARRQKEGAIAVVLSGASSDGTLGLRGIKAAGGITFAQDDTAQFQGMPRAAIIEGVIDRVLPPVEIAKELERLSSQISVFAQTLMVDFEETEEADNQETPLNELMVGSDDELQGIIQLLRRSVGMDFTHYKMTTIRRRIVRRTLLYKLNSLSEYTEYLLTHPEEATLLYDDLLINVTTFFRDANTMDYVQKVLLPKLVREKPAAEPIRIWVPACSTGQEAYSLAMLLLEVLGEQAVSRSIQVFATDLSESAVAKARLGCYTRSEVMGVSARRLQRFFTKVDDQYRINKSVRDLCVFAPHNLLKDPPFSRLDLISCRNLLIYLDTSLQRKAIVTFHYALTPSGYLILGKSETVGSSAQLFSQTEKNYRIFTRRNDIDSRVTFTMTPRQPDKDSETPQQSRTSKRPGQIINGSLGRSLALGTERVSGPDFNLDKVVDNLLMNQYVPASVVVNQDMDILQFRGATSLFLEPAQGKASLNLIKMARPSLVFELRNAVNKAQKSNELVRKSGLEFKVKNKTHYVAIEAIPLDAATEDRLFLITFEEVDPPVVSGTQSTGARNNRIRELENELASLREDMRSVIEEQETSNEELQSASEEIISSNEELQSINEELETSKEEIESTNEELLTINQELQVRNDQLSEAYQFSEDIFQTIREATLVLDTDLRIKSANPAFYRLFQLTEDVTERRLIYELDNRQWDLPQLRLMLIDTITSGASFQGFELTYASPTVGEKQLSLNARRVVRQQDSILLAIDDVTDNRQAQKLLAEREAWFHGIADNTPTLIWVTNANNQVTFLNKVWLEYTDRSLEDVAKHGWIASLHPDDQPAYEATHSHHLKNQQAFKTEYRLYRRDGEYHWMLENAQPLFNTDGVFSGYIGSLADVHLQKEMNQELDRRVQERTKELEHTNELISMALKTSQAGLRQWDSHSNTTVWDERGREIIGFATEQEMLSSDGWLNRIHPDDREQVQHHFLKSMETGELFWMEYRVVHDDGSLRYVLGTGQMKKDANGEPLNSSGLVIDITPIKLAEQSLRQRTIQLNAVVENTPDVITRWDKDLLLIFANEASVKKLGQPLDALLGKTYAQMEVPLSITQPYMDKLRKTFETGQPQEHYSAFPTAGGLVQFFSRIVPEFGPDGVVESVLSTARDITELQQTTLNLQAVLNSSPAAIGFLKPIRESSNEVAEPGLADFRLAVSNEKFALMAAQPIGQLANQHVSQLASKLWQEHTIDIIGRVLETGEPFQDERYEADKDQWMLVTLTKYDGGVVLTGLDISPLKKAVQQQEHLLDELDKSNDNLLVLGQLRQQLRERGELLRSTSHDLRGNFGIIQGAATLLDMANTDEERAQMLSMLQRNLRQATQMLTELLDVARLEAGQEQRQITSLRVAELLGGLVESMQPLADERQLWLRVEGSEDLLVEGDTVKVHRIAQNLLLNALKYTRTGGVTVRWGAAPTPDRWQLTITDTGPGLPQEAQSKSGEGIGLTIVRQLGELLNCRMDVESRPEGGTQFQLYFPRKYSS